MNALRILVLTAILLTVYYTSVFCHVLPQGSPATLRQIALSKAANYRERTFPPVIALAGTSKTAYIQPASFDVDVENLAIQGGVSLTGLFMIDRCKHSPRIVMVEMNRFSVRSGPDEVIKNYFRQPTNLFSVSSDCRKRPPNVLFSMIRQAFPGSERKVDNRYKEVMRKHRPSLISGFTADSQTMAMHCSEIKKIVRRLQKRNIRVLLYDIPIDSDVEQAGEMLANRLIQKTFPPDEFEWLPMPAGKFATADSIHLTSADLHNFVQALQCQLEKKRLLCRSSNGRFSIATTGNAL